MFLRGERGGEEYMGVCPWRVVRQGQGVGAGQGKKRECGVRCVGGRGRVLAWSQMDGDVDRGAVRWTAWGMWGAGGFGGRVGPGSGSRPKNKREGVCVW